MQNYRYHAPDYMQRQNGNHNRQQSNVEPCPCSNKDDVLEGMPIAMAYVPWQVWKCPLEVEKGFQRGTIFEDLYKPFRGIGGCSK